MKRFTELFMAMDRTNRTSEKVQLLTRYFQETPPEDAAWALAFLSGDRLKRVISSRLMADWAMAEAGISDWLFEESYSAVGDLGETIALLLAQDGPGTDLPLHQMVEERLRPLPKLDEEARKELMLRTWRELNTDQKFVWNKIINGSFRVGVSKTLVVRALASVAKVPAAVMAHRLMGTIDPSRESFERLLSDASHPSDVAKPYPFFLAYPVEGKPEELGDPKEWQAEWKWDGIRGQLIVRSSLDGNKPLVALWSRGEELVTDRYPDIIEAASSVPLGTVLDGEILAFQDGVPLSFGRLQQRIGLKRVTPKLRLDVPVIFMIYDVLEWEGKDVRTKSLSQRRQWLDALVSNLPTSALRLSSLIEFSEWSNLDHQFAQAREKNVEGLMLKRRDSPYGTGRQKGNWWKWKVDPYHIDAVLMYAQHGHGRRASLYTDYTFGLWREGTLVPVAKAYSGLTDEEIRQVDAYVRRNTLDRFGPVRVVKPELVFELAFEGIQRSPRHKSGVAVRFPRMARWRHDKPAAEADLLSSLEALMSPLPSSHV